MRLTIKTLLLQAALALVLAVPVIALAYVIMQWER